ncbi:hypothetical protein BDW59DRAFT_147991 [Aspergillus cavernicola]|uniref:Zn(2)-C6 fungal-type domain-containing protein n=1 Tax=Aspergillus cavernicola TaxID=176166 RepID=A0ABR4I9N8_9EURO
MSPRNVFCARASRNCSNCRAVKRRCDQQLPHCGQCTRMREECPGYRDEWELVFRDQTDHTIQRSNEKRAKRTASTGANHSPPPPRGLSPSIDEIGVNYFLHNFVIGGQSPSRGFLNYIPPIFSADGEHPTLVASMAAVGLVALANSTQQPELVSHARVKYSEAIRNVNTALTSPVESVKDSTLMSVISLGVFEHVSNFESWVQHVQGAAALVVARGKGQFCSTASILMFNQVRADMAVACLHGNQPFPEHMRELQEEAAKHADTSSAWWLLGVLATRCANLLWSITNNTEKIPWSDFLKVATVLQGDFQFVFGLLAIQEPYTTTRESGGDPDIIYNGRYDLYRTSWAIRVWNNSRNLQMIVCEVTCYLLNKVLTTDLSPVIRAQLKLKLQETLQVLSTLGEDMLATVPQALGFISSASEHHISVNCFSHTSMSGGYILTWCLYMVGKSPLIKSKTRKWIIRHLQNIGKNAGIAIALQLLEDVVQIDQSAG